MRSAYFTLVVFKIIFFKAIQCQITDPPTLTAITALRDQPECAKNCLVGRNCQGSLCGGVEDYLGCKANKCLCRPDLLASGMEFVSSCAAVSCTDTNAGNSIQTVLREYCVGKAPSITTLLLSSCLQTDVVTLPLDPITVTLVGGQTTVVSLRRTTITLLPHSTAVVPTPTPTCPAIQCAPNGPTTPSQISCTKEAKMKIDILAASTAIFGFVAMVLAAVQVVQRCKYRNRAKTKTDNAYELERRQNDSFGE